MSYVTSIVLVTSVHEGRGDDDLRGPQWRAVQDWLGRESFAPLAFVEEHASGTKGVQMFVGLGGYNWFPHERFVEMIRQIEWRDPDHVVLTICTEDGETMVIRPSL